MTVHSLDRCLPETEDDVRPWQYIVWTAVCLRLQLEQIIGHGLILHGSSEFLAPPPLLTDYLNLSLIPNCMHYSWWSVWVPWGSLNEWGPRFPLCADWRPHTSAPVIKYVSAKSEHYRTMSYLFFFLQGCRSPLVVKFADTQKEKEMKKLQQMNTNLLSMANLAGLGALGPQYLAVRIVIRVRSC